LFLTGKTIKEKRVDANDGNRWETRGFSVRVKPSKHPMTDEVANRNGNVSIVKLGQISGLCKESGTTTLTYRLIKHMKNQDFDQVGQFI